MTKALTLYQPWAQLVVLGIKTIETRSWSTSYRGPLAIHAGLRKPRGWCLGERRTSGDGPWHDDLEPYCRARRSAFDGGYWSLRSWTGPLGAIVATCELVDVLPIVDVAESWPCVVSRDGRLALEFSSGYFNGNELEPEGIDLTDQLPYGDFAPGRYAWIFEGIKSIEPVPAKRRQGLWNWEV